MRKVLLLFLLTSSLFAQTDPVGQVLPRGTSLPATCEIGSVYNLLVDGEALFYSCITTDTWQLRAIKRQITAPVSCLANKDLWIDTDATPAGQQLFLCNSAGNGWNLVGDGGGVGGGITTLNTLTADPQTFAVGTTGTDFAISSVTATHTFNIPDASATARGLITTGIQTIAGVKTFSDLITGAVSGNAGTATALAGDPTDCTAGQYANAIATSGNLTCAQIAYSQLSGTHTAPSNEAGAANNFLTAYNSTTGAFSKAQPSFSNISSTATTAQLPAAILAASKSISLLDPVTGDTNKIQIEFASAITITEVVCSTDTGTVTIQLDERARATPNTAGTDVMTSTLVCDNNSQATTTFTNAGIAADVPLNLQITAVASAPTAVRIHIQYTVD